MSKEVFELNDEEIKDANLAIKESTSLDKPFKGLDLPGLEEVSASIIPIPYVRVVQPTSQNIELLDGTEAPAGSFYFNNTKESTEYLKFALLKARQGIQSFERDGQVSEVPKIAILGMNLETNKMFVLTLSVTSFFSFGQLVAQLKGKEATNSWSFEIVATTEKTENDKGKYYIVNFEVRDQLEKAQMTDFAKKSSEFGVVLDRKQEEE